MSSEKYDPRHFIMTAEHGRFAEFCDDCRRYRYIGVCYGQPGVGKTWSAFHYNQWGLVDEATRAVLQSDPLPPEAAHCRTVVYRARVVNTPRQVEGDIALLRRRLNGVVREALAPAAVDYATPWMPVDCMELLIVDEGNRLKDASIEQLRDLYDDLQSDFGLVIIGTPGIEKRLARYPQLYSRVGFVHQYRKLKEEDLRVAIARKWDLLSERSSHVPITDEEAVAAIMRISGSNFRLMTQLLAQIQRILNVNNLTCVTAKVVERASKYLVMGEE